jgi:V/A-type H+-transporting ATPase subunit A
VLRTGRLLREDFLAQSSFDERDATCSPAKQFLMLEVIRRAHEAMAGAVARGIDAETAGTVAPLSEVGQMRSWLPEDAPGRAPELAARIEAELEGL